MAMEWQSLRVNEKRFLADFAELSEIGSTNDGGVNRPSLSPADLEARNWFKQKIEQAGLDYRIDAAGNQSAWLACGPRDGQTLMLGSHLDSVYSGGRFDGALGVLAALEALRVVKEAKVILPVNLEAINFTDEEATLVGFLGSRALTGDLDEETLRNPKAGRAVLEERFAGAGLALAQIFTARRERGKLLAYLELHIEQGPVLAESEKQIGLVSRIIGISAYRLSFHGRADHSGTTPLPRRLDAGLGAAGFILAARELVLRDYPGCVVNVGQVGFEPGASNIVPRRANLLLEFRSPDAKQLSLLELALLKTARAQAERFGLLIESDHLWTDPPAVMDAKIQAAILAAANDLQLSSAALSSGAGHDAQILSSFCPAGMIFVPSVDGASHAPREFTKNQDCINGANVLLQAALRIAAG